MSEVKRYSLKRQTVKIELEDESGTTKTYTLKELTGTARDEYQSFMASKMKMDTKGRPSGLKDVKGQTLKLITLGMFDEADNPVTEAEANKWPGRVQSNIASDITEMSGLGDRAVEEAKND